MDYPGFPMGPGGMMPFQGAHPMMMASMQHAAFQQGRPPFQQPGQGGGNPPDRHDSIFFKTRICNKWRDSECPFGDSCNFAHGDHDLRTLPPEGEEILARKFQGNPRPPIQNESSTQRPAPPGIAAPAPVANSNLSLDNPDVGSSPDHLPIAGGPPPAQSAAIQSSSTAGAGSSEAGKPGQQGDPAAAQRFFKTRLCNKFMNTGSCQYGDTCKYAHGHGDIRQPGSLAAAEGQGQFPGQFPGHMQDMAHNFEPMYGAGFGMPGGPPMPPGAPGMPMPGMPFGPRPPPGPPPSGPKVAPPRQPAMPPPSSPTSAAGMDARQAGGLLSQHAGKSIPSVPAMERIRAMCSILGLGPEMKDQDYSSPAAHAAIGSIRDGSAFRDSMYADGIDRYFR